MTASHSTSPSTAREGALFHRKRKVRIQNTRSTASHWLSYCQERSLSSSGWALLLSQDMRAPPSGLLTLFKWGLCLLFYTQFSSVQLLSHVRIFVTPWTAARQASLSITNSRSLLRLMSIELVMPSPSPPAFSISQHQGLFQWVVLHIRWAKYWSFSFIISPSNDYSGLISFRRDWLDLLEVQGTLKSLLQHHTSKASILQCLAFFIVQLSHPFMTTGKTIALTQ